MSIPRKRRREKRLEDFSKDRLISIILFLELQQQHKNSNNDKAKVTYLPNQCMLFLPVE